MVSAIFMRADCLFFLKNMSSSFNLSIYLHLYLLGMDQRGTFADSRSFCSFSNQSFDSVLSRSSQFLRLPLTSQMEGVD